MDIYNCRFLQLLRVAVGSADSLEEQFTAEEWCAMRQLAQKHSLIGVVFSAIERLPKEQRPPSRMIVEWYVAVERIKKANVALTDEAVRLQEMLHAFAFNSAILKGQGIAKYYPDSLLRMPGDIDIWLEGGMHRILRFLRPRFCLGEIVYHHVDAHLSDIADVEVHFRPSWLNNPLHNYRLQRWFRTEEKRQMRRGGQSADEQILLVPDDEFNIVYLILHIYRHFFDEGVGLRQLMDLYFVLVHESDFPGSVSVADRCRSVVSKLESFGLKRFAGAVMFVLCRVFGLQAGQCIVPPDKVLGEMLLEEVLIAGNFGKYDMRKKSPTKVGTLANLARKTKRNMRFVRYFPDEVLWDVPFKICHYFWRVYINRKYKTAWRIL